MQTIQKTKSKLVGLGAVLVLTLFGHMSVAQAQDLVKLQFSDGRSNVSGMENVNAVLRSIGVRTSTVPIPQEAQPILKASQTRAISEDEQQQLISQFSLNRVQLLEQIRLAGRTPEVHRGGLLGTKVGYRPLCAFGLVLPNPKAVILDALRRQLCLIAYSSPAHERSGACSSMT